MNNASIRIGVLHFSHETVTFLKNDTTLDDFIYPGSPAKGEALLNFDPKYFMGGFVKMAREFDGVELVGIELPLWPKTYMGSGWVTQEAYETFVGRMIEEIKLARAVRRHLSLPARRDGGARRASPGGRAGAAGARGGRAEGLHRRDLRSPRQ